GARRRLHGATGLVGASFWPRHRGRHTAIRVVALALPRQPTSRGARLPVGNPVATWRSGGDSAKETGLAGPRAALAGVGVVSLWLRQDRADDGSWNPCGRCRHAGRLSLDGSTKR